jgi:hypothetical protein
VVASTEPLPVSADGQRLVDRIMLKAASDDVVNLHDAAARR